MSAPLPVVESTPPRVCRHLRGKVPFSTPEELVQSWELGAASNASYWCLATLEAAGPDDGVAHAQDCRSGRACFE